MATKYISKKFVLDRENMTTIKLDQPLELRGNWKIGLKNFSLQNNFSMLNEKIVILYANNQKTTLFPKSYRNQNQINEILKEMFPKTRAKRAIIGIGDDDDEEEDQVIYIEEGDDEEEGESEEKKEETKKDQKEKKQQETVADEKKEASTNEKTGEEKKQQETVADEKKEASTNEKTGEEKKQQETVADEKKKEKTSVDQKNETSTNEKKEEETKKEEEKNQQESAADEKKEETKKDESVADEKKEEKRVEEEKKQQEALVEQKKEQTIVEEKNKTSFEETSEEKKDTADKKKSTVDESKQVTTNQEVTQKKEDRSKNVSQSDKKEKKTDVKSHDTEIFEKYWNKTFFDDKQKIYAPLKTIEGVVHGYTPVVPPSEGLTKHPHQHNIPKTPDISILQKYASEIVKEKAEKEKTETEKIENEKKEEPKIEEEKSSEPAYVPQTIPSYYPVPVAPKPLPDITHLLPKQTEVQQNTDLSIVVPAPSDSDSEDEDQVIVVDDERGTSDVATTETTSVAEKTTTTDAQTTTEAPATVKAQVTTEVPTKTTEVPATTETPTLTPFIPSKNIPYEIEQENMVPSYDTTYTPVLSPIKEEEEKREKWDQPIDFEEASDFYQVEFPEIEVDYFNFPGKESSPSKVLPGIITNFSKVLKKEAVEIEEKEKALDTKKSTAGEKDDLLPAYDPSFTVEKKDPLDSFKTIEVIPTKNEVLVSDENLNQLKEYKIYESALDAVEYSVEVPTNNNVLTEAGYNSIKFEKNEKGEHKISFDAKYIRAIFLSRGFVSALGFNDSFIKDGDIATNNPQPIYSHISITAPDFVKSFDGKKASEFAMIKIANLHQPIAIDIDQPLFFDIFPNYIESIKLEFWDYYQRQLVMEKAEGFISLCLKKF